MVTHKRLSRTPFLPFTIVTWFAITCTCAAQSPTIDNPNAQPAVSRLTDRSIAFDSTTGKTFIVDPQHNRIWIWNGATTAPKSVEVGRGPTALAVHRRLGRVYACLSDDGLVAVLDAKTNQILAKLPVGPHPYTLAIDESHDRVYVTNTFSDIVAVIHSDTDAVELLHLGSKDAVAVDEITHNVLFTSYEDPNLSIFDPQTGKTEKVHIGEHIWALAVDQQSATVFLTRIGSAELIAVDERTHTKRVVDVGAFPSALAVDHAANRLFVANYGDGTLTTLELASLKLIATAHVGSRPQAILVDARQKRVYVASAHNRTIYEVDEDTGKPRGQTLGPERTYGLGMTQLRGVYEAVAKLNSADGQKTR